MRAPSPVVGLPHGHQLPLLAEERDAFSEHDDHGADGLMSSLCGFGELDELTHRRAQVVDDDLLSGADQLLHRERWIREPGRVDGGA